MLWGEIDERVAAASHFADGGRPEWAATLQAEARCSPNSSEMS